MAHSMTSARRALSSSSNTGNPSNPSSNPSPTHHDNPTTSKLKPTNTNDNFNTIQNIHDATISEEDLNLAKLEVLAPETIQNRDPNDPNITTTSNDNNENITTLNLDNIPGTSKGKRLLAIIYTCNVCNTRSAKKFTEHAYNHGVVLVRCPNCESLHLIADRLGFFTDKEGKEGGENGWDIQSFMKKLGKDDNVKVVSRNNEEVLEVVMDDLIGSSSTKG